MVVFDKSEIKKALTVENIFDLLQQWGGDPIYTGFGILSATICHNPPGEGSKKLYYYSNSNLFHCYTGCSEPSFDIFELFIKVYKIQFNEDVDLNTAVRKIAYKFNISGKEEVQEEDKLEDWKYISNYERIKDINPGNGEITLKEYDKRILSRFNYEVEITPWLDEGISQPVLAQAQISYYPGGEQIVIPHFDVNDRLIGIRGRTLIQEDGEHYGKYRPLFVNQQWYNHPLGMNLYGLNFNKEAIQIAKTAIIFEGEKSVLKYGSYFGEDNNISVACCGSNISACQIQLLLKYKINEIVIAFDRQFESIGDDQFNKLKKNLIGISSKYKNYVKVSFIFDKNKITSYKASPIDEGKDKFIKLLQERISL
jgi:hypothetical protein